MLRHPTRPRPGPSLALYLALSLPILAPATPLSEVQAAAAKWADLRSETTRLETDWITEQSLLEASIANLNNQAEELELQRDTLLARTAKDRQEIADLTAANQKRADQLNTATARITELAAQLKALRPALPPRLSDALELPFRSIAAEDLSPADRMRHTMAILNRCQQFDRTFVVAEEILATAPDEAPRLLEVVYFGLAQACALDRSAGEAFMGRPIDGVWQWENVPGLADAAERLLAVRLDEIPPEFVNLPIQITGGAQ
jgi:hypothetical protein